MKVMVTGGAGFIGSHVVDGLLAAGHDVVVVDDLSTGHAANINPAASFYRTDIRSPELVDVLLRERPEVISHHAAQSTVIRSLKEPALDATVNVIGSINLLQAAHQASVRKIISISTGGARPARRGRCAGP